MARVKSHIIITSTGLLKSYRKVKHALSLQEADLVPYLTNQSDHTIIDIEPVRYVMRT